MASTPLSPVLVQLCMLSAEIASSQRDTSFGFFHLTDTVFIPTFKISTFPIPCFHFVGSVGLAGYFNVRACTAGPYFLPCPIRNQYSESAFNLGIFRIYKPFSLIQLVFIHCLAFGP